MSDQTNIEWADSTFNPWMGCTKVSPACDHCYAERDTRRFGRVEWGAGKPRVRTTSVWNYPARWNRETFVECDCGYRGTLDKLTTNAVHRCNLKFRPARRRVFCASLADWLDNEVPIDWRVDLMDLIARTPNLDWLLLTKRIGNWRNSLLNVISLATADRKTGAADLAFNWLEGRPPANVWLGSTVINQAEADRDVPKLLAVPARVRFLSIEPMLGPIDLTRLDLGDLYFLDALRGQERILHDGGMPTKGPFGALHWIIAGGESGPHARPSHPDWYRSLRDQCAAAGVPFLFKQWGEWGEFVNEDHYTHAGEEKHAHAWVDRATGEHGKVWLVDDDGMWSNWTGDPRSADIGGLHDDIAVVGKHGKKAAGRQLDGRTHDGFPAVQP